MNRGLIALFAALLALGIHAQNVALPSVKDILAKSIASCGGKAYTDIKTMQMDGTIEMPMGDAGTMKGTYQLVTKAPDKSLMTQDLGQMGKMRVGTDGKVAWTENAFQGAQILPEKDAAAAKAGNGMNALACWDEYFAKSEVTGVEKVGDLECYVVKATPKEKGASTPGASPAAGAPPMQFYFDNKEYLVRQVSMTNDSPQGKMAGTMTISDYKEVQGVRSRTRWSRRWARWP
jgi:outer membrane lipoprotein-sorting protein